MAHKAYYVQESSRKLFKSYLLFPCKLCTHVARNLI